MSEAQLAAVLQLHTKETRYIDNNDGTISFDSRDEALEYYDAEDADIIEFPLCAECKRLEESPDDICTQENGYRESMWPCRTIIAIQAAQGELSLDDQLAYSQGPRPGSWAGR